MFQPTRAEFHEYAKRGNLVPVYRELPADLETPVSVYLKLRGQSNQHPERKGSFLLESVEGGEQIARYSFIGVNPSRVLTIHGNQVTHDLSDFRAATGNQGTEGIDPLDAVRAMLSPYRMVEMPGLPRFVGGAVGFLGYDMVRHFDRIRTQHDDSYQTYPLDDLPDAVFMLADTLVAFDHVQHRMLVIANAHVNGDTSKAYDDATARINQLIARLRQPLYPPTRGSVANGFQLESNVSPERYCDMVRRAQEHIAAGDILQVVLSQRFERETHAEAFEIYRALRRLNPSPYMFFLDLGDTFAPLSAGTQFVGASPEMLVRLEDGVAQLNPIAGTRRRGANAQDDARLAQELQNDPKERAEHVMLVDLGRNDLGRVCEFGSVRVQDYAVVERYSHVMHLVSRVVGNLRANYDAFDLVRATFPAGTLSGAPKVRAMEIIDALENAQRGPYAGAVGYFGFPTCRDGAVPRLSANMDLCITIRTIVMRDQHAFIQAGAGIVADSIPEREYQECVNKAKALAEAIRMAEEEV
ncbi:MAG: anthranilate synthase component I [Chloroflexi bacterium]|nr:anthranilate synthase component I [Chloroflexota bacterium]